MKKVTKKAIMLKLGIEKANTASNMMFTRDTIIPVDEVRSTSYDDWNLDDRGLTSKGFVQMGNVLTYEAKKSTYTESKVGYWSRQYIFFYNPDTDQVAVLYKYYFQFSGGPGGAKRVKKVYLYSGESFR